MNKTFLFSLTSMNQLIRRLQLDLPLLTSRQIEQITRKYSEQVITRSLNSLSKYKPGDMKYFRGALKYYQELSVKKITVFDRPELHERSPAEKNPEAFRVATEEGRKKLQEIASKKIIYNCLICGPKEFHSTMAHGWKRIKLHALKECSCTPCQEAIQKL